jgi:AcrR family transcriptional regulator
MRRVLSEADLGDFRDRVCSVATEMLAELGFDGFNMRQLAGRLGVSAMTTYRYFDSKNDIFEVLRVKAFNRLASRLEGLDLSGPPLKQLTTFCGAYVEFAREEPVLYRLMFDLSQPQIARSLELESAERRLFLALVDGAGLFARRDKLGNEIEWLAHNLWASLHGLVVLSVMKGIGDSELDSLLLDMVCRFSGSNAYPAQFEHGPQPAELEPQACGIRRTNGAAKSDWIPLIAAD